MNIATTYCDFLAACDLSLTEGLQALNRALDAKYTLSRLGTWRSGKRSIPAHVAMYMRRECLSWAIRRRGGKPPRGIAIFVEEIS